MASTTHSIRQQNKQLVLKTLFQNGALFASDLVKKPASAWSPLTHY